MGIKINVTDKRPWLTEPNRVEFQHAGFTCLIQRHSELLSLCGYVAVPLGHPWHGKHYADNDLGISKVCVHGGLTYSSICHSPICHVSDEPDNVWWFGFDCSHFGDFVPGLTKYRTFDTGVYRDIAYVRNQVEKLAEQLREVAAGKR